MTGSFAKDDKRETGASDELASAPAVFHVTHWKAGSSWLTKILRQCDRRRFVRSRRSVAHVLEDPIRPGGVYPRVYLTREQFDDLSLPDDWRRFVVIRDLRDTLVSAYFSVRFSHPENPSVEKERALLEPMTMKEGLAWMLDRPVVRLSAEIQRSWIRAGVRITRYEDLVERQVPAFRRLLVEECGFPLAPQDVRRIVRRAEFERLSGGRPRGDEDVTSHYRKAVPGDWRGYFDESLKASFKDRWGEVLIESGYEDDSDW
jgi:hypothetical protein